MQENDSRLWCKIWADSLVDNVIVKMKDAEFGRWIKLLLCRCSGPIENNMKSLCRITNTDKKAMLKTLELLEQCGLIHRTEKEIVIKNWAKRQGYYGKNSGKNHEVSSKNHGDFNEKTTEISGETPETDSAPIEEDNNNNINTPKEKDVVQKQIRKEEIRKDLSTCVVPPENYLFSKQLLKWRDAIDSIGMIQQSNDIKRLELLVDDYPDLCYDGIMAKGLDYLLSGNCYPKPKDWLRYLRNQFKMAAADPQRPLYKRAGEATTGQPQGKKYTGPVLF